MKMRTKREERATSQQSSWPVVMTAATVGIVYGYDQGSIGSALLFLVPDFNLSTTMVSVVTTGVPVGTFFGALFGGKIANRVGRKKAMMGIAIGFTLFSGLQGVMVDPWSLAVTRVLLGLVVGVTLVATPQFIAESAPTRIRGSMVIVFEIATATGLALSYFVGLGLASTESWRLILSLSAVPALGAVALLWNLPDTPRWYVMEGRRAEARARLQEIESNGDLVDSELEAIEEDIRVTRSGTYRKLFKGPLRRAGVFVVGLGFFVQITGINAIIFYGPRILQAAGVTNVYHNLLASALVQVAGLLAAICSFIVIDRWGRRPTLLTGITIMIVANVILSLAFFGETSAGLGITGNLMFNIGFVFGYGSLVYVYAAESMPAQMRAVGGSALMAADLLGNILVGLFFPGLMESMGGTVTFALFAGLSVLAFGFIWVLAPETKGRPLESIRLFWENGGKWPTTTSASVTSDIERNS